MPEDEFEEDTPIGGSETSNESESEGGSDNPEPLEESGGTPDNPEEGDQPDTGGNPVSNPITPNSDSFSALRDAQSKLIRKTLGGVILVGDLDAEIPDKFFTGPGTLADLKAAGFNSLGWLTKADGINFTRETEQAEVESFGALEPTRIDFTKDVTSSAFRCQETNKSVLEMYHNVNLDEVTVDSETGEFSFDSPEIPEALYRRVIYIARDGNGPNAKYIIKVMPRAIVSEVQEQGWTSESELSYGMTVKATRDDDYGYSVSHRFGGPGFLALAADMGFDLSV